MIDYENDTVNEDLINIEQFDANHGADLYKGLDKKQAENILLDIVGVLENLRTENVTLIDTNSKNTEFLYIIIATVSSKTHLNGVNKEIDDELTLRDIEFINSKNIKDADEWIIIDGYYFLIHLMSKRCREYYKIESLSKDYIVIK